MNSLGRNNADKGKNTSSIFTKETLGVVFVLFATLLMVCLITRETVFSLPGQYVNAFLLGCFGYFAYAVVISLFVLGVCMIVGKKTMFYGKRKALLSLTLILLAVLVHVITYSGGEGVTFGEYISNSYLYAGGGIATCTGGGFFASLIAYPIVKVLSVIGSYVVLSVLVALSGYALFNDFKKGGRVSKPKREVKFNTSFVPTEDAQAEEVKEYPIPGVQFPDIETKPAQRLFVNNANDFEFKSKKELKNEDKSLGVKFESSTNGLNIASSGSSYSQIYGKEMQERLDYIKTPAKIDLEKTIKGFGGGVNVSNNIPPVNFSSQDISLSSPVKEEAVVEEQETAIPLYEYDESVKTTPAVVDDALSRAETFSSGYAEIEEIDENSLQVNEAVESFIPLNNAIKDSVIEPVKEDYFVNDSLAEKVEERYDTDFGVENDDASSDVDFGLQETKKFEDDVVEEIVEPPVSQIRNERARGILFGSGFEGVEKTDSEIDDEIFSDRGRGARLQRGQSVFENKSEPKVEAKIESEQKPPVPINREYFRPPFGLLEDYTVDSDLPQENHEERKSIIKQTLEEFHINAIPQGHVQGPSITRYEIMMPPGISVKKVLAYDDDLKMRLSARDGVRIEAPIPGKNLVGIEVANQVKITVGLKEVLEQLSCKKEKEGSLTFAIGKDIVGSAISDNLAKGPHYLVAGATGSGKSVCLNVMIVSLIMRYSPEELRLILIDPKRVEFRIYEHIPHLMIDEIINEPKKVLATLTWAYEEMERRYKTFEDCGGLIVDIDSYNKNIASETVAKMPRIVIIIDELADLMETCKKDLEARIRQLAQKARSAGIHLVLATQRPSVDIITGTIKANLPSRIALKVMNYNDSQTILGEQGAEKLLGNGDMLYKNSSMPGYERYQGAWISTREINNVVSYIKEHNKAYFDDGLKDFLEQAVNPKPEENVSVEGGGDGGENNELFVQALSLAVNSGTISISQLQRRFSIGYPRAGSLLDKMEMMGFVSGNEGSKARRVLLTREEFERRYGNVPD